MDEPSLTRFKTCTKCGMTLPATTTFFYRAKTYKYGVQARCIGCFKRIGADYKQQRAEQDAEYQRKYREANRTKRNEYDRQWRAQNGGGSKLKRRVREQQRRALKRLVGGSHTPEDVRQMYHGQGGLCAYCETPLFGDYEVDHMIPLVRGGANDWTNLAVVCPPCNRKKHARTAEEYMMVIR